MSGSSSGRPRRRQGWRALSKSKRRILVRERRRWGDMGFLSESFGGAGGAEGDLKIIERGKTRGWKEVVGLLTCACHAFVLFEHTYNIHPEFRIGDYLISFEKGSRAAAVGAPLEQGGAPREQGRESTEKTEYEGSRIGRSPIPAVHSRAWTYLLWGQHQIFAF